MKKKKKRICRVKFIKKKKEGVEFLLKNVKMFLIQQKIHKNKNWKDFF